MISFPAFVLVIVFCHSCSCPHWLLSLGLRLCLCLNIALCAFPEIFLYKPAWSTCDALSKQTCVLTCATQWLKVAPASVLCLTLCPKSFAAMSDDYPITLVPLRHTVDLAECRTVLNPGPLLNRARSYKSCCYHGIKSFELRGVYLTGDIYIWREIYTWWEIYTWSQVSFEKHLISFHGCQFVAWHVYLAFSFSTLLHIHIHHSHTHLLLACTLHISLTHTIHTIHTITTHTI